MILGDEPGSPVPDRLRQGVPTASPSSVASTGCHVDPEALVADLGVGDRQRVEILKVLYRGARILILDEPTAVLVPQEVDELFQSLRELTTEGVTVSSSATSSTRCSRSPTRSPWSGPVARSRSVLPTERDGARARGADGGQRAAHTRDPRVDRHRRGRARRRRAHRRRGRAARCSTTCRSPSTAARSSASPASRATASASSSRRSSGSVRRRAAASRSAASTSRTRARDSGASTASGTSPRTANTTACCCRRRCGRTACSATRPRRPTRKGAVDRPCWRARAHRRRSSTTSTCARRASTSPRTRSRAATSRSSSWVARCSPSPKLLIASHPTRGIDVGAQAAVWESIREARRPGLAVLLVSADLEELIGLSDTLLVILRGRIVADPRPGDRHAGRPRLVHDGRQGGERRVTLTRRIFFGSAAPVAAVVLSLVISAIVLWASGYDAIDAFKAMWSLHRLDGVGRRRSSTGRSPSTCRRSRSRSGSR